ncbi:hypothetical protein H2248_002726 [Termitomyces sp. 'cryptogamus']|nr:hypothetical protein H2248_002726 [Termitomyces sp. 'cryptogamus']
MSIRSVSLIFAYVPPLLSSPCQHPLQVRHGPVLRRYALTRPLSPHSLPPGYANTVIGSVNTREPSGQFPRASTPTLPVLTRIYGPEALAKHNYSTIVNSTGFAGTLVGMLFFGKSPPPSTCSTHPSRFPLRQDWQEIRHGSAPTLSPANQ